MASVVPPVGIDGSVAGELTKLLTAMLFAPLDSRVAPFDGREMMTALLAPPAPLRDTRNVAWRTFGEFSRTTLPLRERRPLGATITLPPPPATNRPKSRPWLLASTTCWANAARGTNTMHAK